MPESAYDRMRRERCPLFCGNGISVDLNSRKERVHFLNDWGDQLEVGEIGHDEPCTAPSLEVAYEELAGKLEQAREALANISSVGMYSEGPDERPVTLGFARSRCGRSSAEPEAKS